MGELLGRLHPLIVHLPVGMLIAAFIMELASRYPRFSYLKKSVSFVLLLTIFSAILAWFTGWIMPKEGDFNAELVQLHFWFSLAMTLTTVAVYFLGQTKNKSLQSLYFPLFLVNMILLTITGHYGGSLTHGEDHLTQELSKDTKTLVADVNTLAAFPAVIQPILSKKCFSCHNEGKKKGGLVLSTIEGIQKGGDEGPVLIAGNIAKSTLIQRLHLPLLEKEHMPPKGKRQLDPNEIELLEWWIAGGASFTKLVGDFEQTEKVEKILKSYEQGSSNLNTKGLEVIYSKQLAAFAADGIAIFPHHENSPLVFANLSRDTTITNRRFKKLKKIAKNITELDLSFSNVNDNMLTHLASFENLQKLKLQNTSVSSEGIKHLEKLKNLELLNVYGTQIDNAAFETLDKIKTLKTLFIWQSKVTQEAYKNFSKEHPLMSISYEIDQSLFADAQLKPPVISAAKDIFEDSLIVNLSLNFNNVEVYYTIDGSMPDSTSFRYDSSIVINQTASIKAISLKAGWETSVPSEKVFIKAGLPVKTIQLQKPPNNKYEAEGAASLIDLEKASISFGDGKWLGFEAEDMLATLDLGTAQEIDNVVVGALEETGSYIFFPKGIVVSSSLDGRTFTEQAQLEIPLTEGPGPAKQRSFLVDMEAHEARYLRIKVLGTLKNPPWHAAPGAKNWIFVDEILVGGALK